MTTVIAVGRRYLVWMIMACIHALQAFCGQYLLESGESHRASICQNINVVGQKNLGEPRKLRLSVLENVASHDPITSYLLHHTAWVYGC